jgi:cysteine desulfurase
MTRPVYLDNHATTPLDPEVAAAMWPWFTERFGNAASTNHAFGQEAADAVEVARGHVAAIVHADPRAIVFTSGATEANNLAIKGVLRSGRREKRGHLIVNAAEHRAVLDPARRLEREGFDVTVLQVDEFGAVDPAAVRDALRSETRLVSVMLANNEVGTLNPVAEIAAICRGRNVLVHCDAAQAVGRVPVDAAVLGVDLLSFTAHKLYGPMGVGALYVRRGPPRIRLEPLLDGGGHERGLRSGTLPVPLIVGFGEACRIAAERGPGDAERIGRLRDRLWTMLRDALPDLLLNGHPARRLPGNLNVTVPGVDGDALMTSLVEIAVSSGSACSTTTPDPSHVLRAMGRGDAAARASLRFGVGRFNTEGEIDSAAAYVVERIERLRAAKS